jgi:hypothetical protein
MFCAAWTAFWKPFCCSAGGDRRHPPPNLPSPAPRVGVGARRAGEGLFNPQAERPSSVASRHLLPRKRAGEGKRHHVPLPRHAWERVPEGRVRASSIPKHKGPHPSLRATFSHANAREKERTSPPHIRHSGQNGNASSSSCPGSTGTS